jgi:hypothetical protein
VGVGGPTLIVFYCVRKKLCMNWKPGDGCRYCCLHRKLSFEPFVMIYTFKGTQSEILVLLLSTGPVLISHNKHDIVNHLLYLLILQTYNNLPTIITRGCVSPLWPFHLHFKSILRQKKNYENSNISPMQIYI